MGDTGRGERGLQALRTRPAAAHGPAQCPRGPLRQALPKHAHLRVLLGGALAVVPLALNLGPRDGLELAVRALEQLGVHVRLAHDLWAGGAGGGRGASQLWGFAPSPEPRALAGGGAAAADSCTRREDDALRLSSAAHVHHLRRGTRRLARRHTGGSWQQAQEQPKAQSGQLTALMLRCWRQVPAWSATTMHSRSRPVALQVEKGPSGAHLACDPLLEHKVPVQSLSCNLCHFWVLELEESIVFGLSSCCATAARVSASQTERKSLHSRHDARCATPHRLTCATCQTLAHG